MNALKRFTNLVSNWISIFTNKTSDINKAARQFDKASKQFVKTLDIMNKIKDDVKEDLKKDDEKVKQIEKVINKDKKKIVDIEVGKKVRKDDAKRAENFAKGLNKLMNNEI